MCGRYVNARRDADLARAFDIADVSPTAGHMLAAMVRELVAGLRRS